MKYIFLLFLSLSLFAQESTPVALIVHGLNSKPKAMDAYAQIFKEMKIKTYQVSLTGHSDIINQCKEDLKQIKAHDWPNDVLRIYEEIKTKYPNSPIYFVGHSLGGLLGSTLLNQKKVYFEKMILLAPALNVNLSAHLMRIPLDPSNYVPSFTPIEYSANESTVMAIYQALFEIYDEFHENLKPNHINIPTLVFLDPEDELISFDNTQKFIQKNELTNWNLVKVRKSKGALFDYHHLLHDERTMGKESWGKIKMQIIDFINQ